jgi:cell division protein FtsA
MLVLSKTLPFGSGYITNDLIQAFSVSHDHAEGIKKYYAKLDNELYHQNIMLDCNDTDTTDTTIPYDFLHDIIESRTEELVYLIREELTEYLPKETEQLADATVYVTGGCVELSSFIHHIEKIFAMTVKVVMPSKVAQEYRKPASSAVYGVLRYAAANLSPEYKAPSVWKLVISKAKNMFGS